MRERKLSAVKISKKGPPISYLFFADDTLIFCKAYEQNAEEIRNILAKYEVAFG